MTRYYCFGTLDSKEDVHVLGSGVDYYVPQHVVQAILDVGHKGKIEKLIEALKMTKAPKGRIKAVVIVWWCFQDA